MDVVSQVGGRMAVVLFLRLYKSRKYALQFRRCARVWVCTQPRASLRTLLSFSLSRCRAPCAFPQCVRHCGLLLIDIEAKGRDACAT